MVNISLQSAVVPQSLKVASLQPCLKKASLDPDEFNSFRLISNLKFISKSIEKVVADQACQYVKNNNLEELYQSAYKTSHSTENRVAKSPKWHLKGAR